MSKHILLTVVLLAACGSKKENKSEGGATATPAAPTAPAAAPGAPAAPAVGKLDCDKVLPKAMQEKYFTSKGYTVGTPSPPPAFDWVGKCQFEPPKEEKPDMNNLKYGATLDASCHQNMVLSKKAVLEAMPKQFKEMKPIDGMPESLAHSPHDGAWQFHAYDQDSNCVISGLLPKEVDGPAFVKEWLAALPPK